MFLGFWAETKFELRGWGGGGGGGGSRIFLFALYPTWDPVHRLLSTRRLNKRPPVSVKNQYDNIDIN